MTQKDRVPGTTLFQAAAHVLDLDGEPPMAEASLEFPVLSGRPDGQYSVHLESSEGGGDSAVVVEPIIVWRGKAGRAIVHVKQHGIELTSVRSECDGDIIDFDAHARIRQRVSGQRCERAAVPFDYRCLLYTSPSPRDCS